MDRTQIQLATVHHRDKTLRRAFSTEEAARAWVAQRRTMAHVVQWCVEPIWLVHD